MNSPLLTGARTFALTALGIFVTGGLTALLQNLTSGALQLGQFNVFEALIASGLTGALAWAHHSFTQPSA